MSYSQNSTPKKTSTRESSRQSNYIEEEQNESQTQIDITKLNRKQLIEMQQELNRIRNEKERQKDDLILEKWKLKDFLDKNSNYK
ncbi:hypothetical protein M9Y10_040063 [Tritrichomonas musculus]|uniref:Uncharacterized protein n=1 Tax=Tritrichomonas musculus TaxID=1915356 RepID=A0ABR2GR15_9EUKA